MSDPRKYIPRLPEEADYGWREAIIASALGGFAYSAFAATVIIPVAMFAGEQYLLVPIAFFAGDILSRGPIQSRVEKWSQRVIHGKVVTY